MQEQHCIELASLPDGEHGCEGDGEPAGVAKLPLATLAGTWYIVLGQNPIYDCFPCQVTICAFLLDNPFQVFTFGMDKAGNPRVVMDYQVERDDGTIVDKRVIELIEQKNDKKEGALSLSGIQNGLMHEEEWRVVAMNKGQDMLVASYCGTMTSWTYHGLVVLARVGGVHQQMETWLDDLGLNSDELCKPKSEDCILKPIYD